MTFNQLLSHQKAWETLHSLHIVNLSIYRTKIGQKLKDVSVNYLPQLVFLTHNYLLKEKVQTQ
jgi:hypothetical protein